MWKNVRGHGTGREELVPKSSLNFVLRESLDNIRYLIEGRIRRFHYDRYRVGTLLTLLSVNY